MRLPPAPVHGADDPRNSADDGAGAPFVNACPESARTRFLSSGSRPSSSRKALHSMARNLELHQHVWLSNSCERVVLRKNLCRDRFQLVVMMQAAETRAADTMRGR